MMRKPNLGSTFRKAIEILLVEDNPGDIRLLKEAFKECYFDARLNIVRDGAEAMSFLRRQLPFENVLRPELILLDLNLPRKDGFETLDESRRNRRFAGFR
jgi:two-component system, chemotaxis family, response regulator Rcp1